MQELIVILENSKTLFYPLQCPWARERISSEFIDNLGTRFRKDSPVLVCERMNADFVVHFF
jgi:hypothetical protein